MYVRSFLGRISLEWSTCAVDDGEPKVGEYDHWLVLEELAATDL
jgi:hypothetical protein